MKDDNRRAEAAGVVVSTPSPNLLVAQPILIAQVGRGWYLRSTAVWSFDIGRSSWNLPFGLGAVHDPPQRREPAGGSSLHGHQHSVPKETELDFVTLS